MAKRKIARKVMPFALLSVAVCGVMAVSTIGSTFAVSADTTGSTFTSDYSSRDEVSEATSELNEELAAEGMVLVKNDGVLPMTSAKPKVSVFGYASVNVQVGASNEGDSSAGVVIADSDLYSSLEDAGFAVNPTTKAFFESAGEEADTIGESDWNSVLSGCASSYSSYSDAAIVMFSGTGTGTARHSRAFDDAQQALVTYLEGQFSKVIILINSSYPYELDQWENDDDVDAILIVGQPGNNGFDAVGKILTGEINPSGHLADLYAADFEVTPSFNNFDVEGVGGTYTEDGVVNGKGMAYYVDGSGNWMDQTRIYQYEEGIYVGYHYYETMATLSGITVGQDSDVVTWPGASDTTAVDGETWYKSFVTYPFGYGLSYTSFEYSNVDISATKTDENGKITADSVITARVTVTNTGDVSGKDVVQVYYSAPWETGEVEKSAVNLIGYEKTNLLQPGESQRLIVKFDASDMASYDYTLNDNAGGYIMDAGTYTVSIRSDSHTVLDDTEDEACSAEFTVGTKITSGLELDTSGNDVTNEFSDVTDTVTGTGSLAFDSALSRDNMATQTTTAPGTLMNNLKGLFVDWSMAGPENTITSSSFDGYGIQLSETEIAEYTQATRIRTAEGDGYDEDGNSIEPLYDIWATGSKETGWTYNGNGPADPDTRAATAAVTASDLIGKDYDDALWDTLLDELDIEEMATLFSYGGYGTMPIEYIGLPSSFQMDGPYGFTDAHGSVSFTNQSLGAQTFPLFCSEVMVACTFNKDLAAAEGNMLAEQGLWGSNSGNGSANTWTGWYSPALNIHRSPFDSRGTEYYSEDPVLSGWMASSVAAAAQAKGLFVTLKHFAVYNDGTEFIRAQRHYDVLEESNSNISLTDDQTFDNDVACCVYSGTSGFSVWADEQTLRETYLRGFEIAVKNSGATGVMSSFAKIGYEYCGANYALLTGVLRNEWGFHGTVISDIVFYGYQDGEMMLMAGNNLALVNNGQQYHDFYYDSITYNGNTALDVRGSGGVLDVLFEIVNAGKADSYDSAFQVYASEYPRAASAMYNALREGVKGVIYTVVNSNAMQVPLGATISYNAASTTLTADVNTAASFDLGGATLSTYELSYAGISGATATYAITSGAIPAGMTLNSATGVLSGTPTTAGVYTFEVTASCDGFASASQTYTVVVSAAATSGGTTDTSGLQSQIDDLQSQINGLGGGSATTAESSSNGLAIAGLVIGCVAVVAAAAAIVLILLKKKG